MLLPFCFDIGDFALETYDSATRLRAPHAMSGTCILTYRRIC